MKTLIILTIALSTMSDHSYKIDFGQNKAGKNWMIVNDGVMGGLSESQAMIRENSIFFEGFLSLKNNGGFASIRKQDNRIDVSNYQKIKIRFKSSGRKFALRLTSSDRYYRPFFKQEFESSTKEWEEIEFQLSDFKEYTINGETGNKLNPKETVKTFSLGLILSDKIEGPFEIEIDYIEFY